MTVSTQHREYEAAKVQWELVRDCIQGAVAVKARPATGATENGANVINLAGTRYLPAPNPTDTSSDNKERYKAYRTRANFANFTAHTKEGMQGMIFRKDADIVLPTKIEYMEQNADGGGMSLEQLAKDVAGDTLETGRHGLLAEFPEAPTGLTVDEVKALNIAATIVPYTAESIINWRTAIIGSTKVLTMVVLLEEHEEVQADGFSVEVKKRYRVLVLEEGVYKQRLYNEEGEPEPFTWTMDEEDEDAEMQPVYELIPTNARGEQWNKIPFVFIGAQNNDETVDKPPLFDLADNNIAHYRNSADYEESCFLVGQPTLAIAGLSKQWVDDVLKGKVMLGSRTAIMLPDGGSASLLQASDNQMPSKGMETKEAQMVKIGARLIQDSSGVETAEAAKIRYAGQNSKLGGLVNNISAGITRVLYYAWLYMDKAAPEDDDDIQFELNTEFYAATIDPQLIGQLIVLGDRGIVAESDVRAILRKTGIIDRPDEEIDQEVEEQDPIDGDTGADKGDEIGEPDDMTSDEDKGDSEESGDGK